MVLCEIEDLFEKKSFESIEIGHLGWFEISNLIEILNLSGDPLPIGFETENGYKAVVNTITGDAYITNPDNQTLIINDDGKLELETE